MVGTEDDVAADRGGVLVTQFWGESDHAVLCEHAAEDDFEPLIVG